MLVSHRHRFIFLKTRKTAGSAVEMAFEPFARPLGWVPPVDAEDGFDTAASVTPDGIVGARGRDAKRDNAVLVDHAEAKAVRKQIGRYMWFRYFKFCTIRNPWDKLVSRFHFRRPQVNSLPKDEVVRRFRDWLVRDHRARNTDHAIYAIGSRPVLDDVVRFENLAEDVARVAETLGVEPLPLPRVHGAHRPAAGSYVDYYDDAARQFVADTYAREIAWFGWRFDNGVPARLPTPRWHRRLVGFRGTEPAKTIRMAGT